MPSPVCKPAIDALAPRFVALERSMLLRVTIMRADADGLRGRLVLGAIVAGHARDQLAVVRRLARRLAAERTGYADVYACLLHAGLAALDPRRGESPIPPLRAAIAQAAAHDMALHLAAARDRLGGLIGGDEGAALRAAAAAYVATEGIADPDRLFAVLVPGVLPR